MGSGGLYWQLFWVRAGSDSQSRARAHLLFRLLALKGQHVQISKRNNRKHACNFYSAFRIQILTHDFPHLILERSNSSFQLILNLIKYQVCKDKFIFKQLFLLSVLACVCNVRNKTASIEIHICSLHFGQKMQLAS